MLSEVIKLTLERGKYSEDYFDKLPILLHCC